jgi:uncharacterized protein YjbI with pentapeptide repeats
VNRKKRTFKQETSSKAVPWWKALYRKTGWRGKTLWDWQALLFVPVTIALIAALVSQYQTIQQLRIEQKRAQSELEVVTQRAQDEALQAYLDQMSHLLLEKDLRSSKEGSVVRTLARARTFAVMQRLDTQRNQTVVRFLGESKLIATDGPTTGLLKGASLDHADLAGVDLRFADLSDADLQGANLHMASLKHANLREVDLSGAASLSSATLEGADLSHSDLSDSDLSDTNLKNANLIGANLENTNLSNAKLKFADLSSDISMANAYVTSLKNADLSSAFLLGADLNGAEMPNADLSHAWVSDADLSNTNLKNVNLIEANLRNANLTGAYTGYTQTSGGGLSPKLGISKEQLRQARSLRGATMPNGQKYEDWLEGNGVYIVDKFDPTFRFEAGKGWRLLVQTVDDAYIEYVPEGATPFGPSGGRIFFTSPLHVFDPSSPSEPKKVAPPENADEWVSWFQRHPNLDTSKPVPVSVGGASGMRIDVTTTSTPENYSQDYCGMLSPCVPLYPNVVHLADSEDRFVMVDVEGETVVIDIAAAADKFDEFVPKAQKVLDTVEWESK